MNTKVFVLIKSYLSKKFILLLFLCTAMLVILSLTYKSGNAQNISQDAEKISSVCKDKNPYQDCYLTRLSDLIKKNDLYYTQKTLEKIWDLDERLRDCHGLTHQLAALAVKQSPNRWKEFLNSTDPQACSGGYFHGILEGHTRFDPEFVLNSSQVDELCGNKGDSYKQSSCTHIFGHLILIDKIGDIDEALSVCDQLTLPSKYCYEGVFMENAVRDNLKDHGISEKPEWTESFAKDLEKLCLSFQDQVAAECWGQMGIVYGSIYDDQPELVFQACSKSIKSEFILNCYYHGIEKMAITADQSKLNIACQPYQEDSEIFMGCVYRIISAMLTTSNKFYGRGMNFCQSLSSIAKEKCVTDLEYRLKKSTD